MQNLIIYTIFGKPGLFSFFHRENCLVDSHLDSLIFLKENVVNVMKI